MKIKFIPDQKLLEVSIDGAIHDIAADCIVRNEVNHWRHLHDPSQVVYAMTEDPYAKYPVMPREFPAGSWQIYAPRRRTDPYRAPYFIPTNAEQCLPVWALDENGGYDHPTGKKVIDLGYGLHHSTSTSTVGCIRIYEEGDLLWLVDQINDCLDRKETMRLFV